MTEYVNWLIPRGRINKPSILHIKADDKRTLCGQVLSEKPGKRSFVKAAGAVCRTCEAKAVTV